MTQVIPDGDVDRIATKTAQLVVGALATRLAVIEPTQPVSPPPVITPPPVVVAPPVVAPAPAPSPAVPIWAVAGSGIEPKGDISITAMAGATLTDKLGSANLRKISFPAGTWADRDFNRPSNYAVYSVFTQKVGSLLGAGRDKTIISVVQDSMTQGYLKLSSLAQFTDANPYFVARFDGSPQISGVTFLGTRQNVSGKPSDYNGVVLFKTTSASMSDVLIKGMYGSGAWPPAETMLLNLYMAVGTQLNRVEIDGMGRSASGIGLNMVAGATLNKVWCHDLPHGSGITTYMSTGALVFTDVQVDRSNWAGLNFERCSNGSITVRRPRIRDCAIDMIVDSDKGSVPVLIEDPDLEPGTKFRVVVAARYQYPPPVDAQGKPLWNQAAANKQLASDIRLTVNGVNRPDLLQIQTSYQPLNGG